MTSRRISDIPGIPDEILVSRRPNYTSYVYRHEQFQVECWRYLSRLDLDKHCSLVSAHWWGLLEASQPSLPLVPGCSVTFDVFRTVEDIIDSTQRYSCSRASVQQEFTQLDLPGLKYLRPERDDDIIPYGHVPLYSTLFIRADTVEAETNGTREGEAHEPTNAVVSADSWSRWFRGTRKHDLSLTALAVTPHKHTGGIAQGHDHSYRQSRASRVSTAVRRSLTSLFQHRKAGVEGSGEEKAVGTTGDEVGYYLFKVFASFGSSSVSMEEVRHRRIGTHGARNSDGKKSEKGRQAKRPYNRSGRCLHCRVWGSQGVNPSIAEAFPLSPNTDAIYSELYRLLRNHCTSGIELLNLPLTFAFIAALERLLMTNCMRQITEFRINDCSLHIEEARLRLLEFFDSGLPVARRVRFGRNCGLVCGEGGMEFLDAMLRTRILQRACDVYVVSG